MAGRQLQRLLRNQLVDEEVESSDEEEARPSKVFNPFDLLTDGDEDGEETTSDEDDGSESGNVSEHPAPSPPPPRAVNKKKSQGEGKKEEEDIDAILQELNIAPAEAACPSSQQSAERPLLAVAPAHLKAADELRRMFGSMRGAQSGRGDSDGAAAYEGASRRIRRLAARGMLVRPTPLRPGAIVAPRDTWPRPDGGISVKSAGPDAAGNPTFRLEYNAHYAAVQALYEECQATFDPNHVAALLRSHPYHLDALLTMVDVYGSMGERNYADEMVERCLYAIEVAWPPGFMAAATAGTARVAYDEANAPLFLAMWRYVQAMGRRGLHRTALEICKLLLQLCPDDPMGAMQVMDYYAVRSGQFGFLHAFAAGQGGGDVSASLLPNMVFSMALARWYQEQEEKDAKKGKAGEGSSGAVRPSSEDLLVKAVLLHPLVVVRLQRRLQEKGVGKDSRWADALARPLLANATDGGCPGLGHLVDIFVERQEALWKAGPIQEWLLAGVRRACGSNPADLPDGLGAADWAAVRVQAFAPCEDNAYSHLRLHDFSDATPQLPAEEIHGMAGAAAAQDEVQAAVAEAQRLMAEAAAAGDGNLEALQATHPLIALLRSLVPWVADGQQPDYAALGDAADGGGGGGGAGGRQADGEGQGGGGE